MTAPTLREIYSASNRGTWHALTSAGEYVSLQGPPFPDEGTIMRAFAKVWPTEAHRSTDPGAP